MEKLLDLLYDGEAQFGNSLKEVLLKVQLTNLIRELGISFAISQVNELSTIK